MNRIILALVALARWRLALSDSGQPDRAGQRALVRPLRRSDGCPRRRPVRPGQAARRRAARFRVLTIVNEHTRQCLALVVGLEAWMREHRGRRSRHAPVADVLLAYR
jgi:hypothetical protein